MTSAERREARYIRRRDARAKKKLMHINQYDNFEDVFSFSNLYNGYQNSIKGVQWKASTQMYKSDALINIARDRQRLLNGTYKSMGFYEFDIFERGKHRHIRSVHISERCIQRTLCDNCLIPVVSRSFIYDNSANIKGRGYDFAINRTVTHLHRYYRQYGSDGYVLMIDFSKFFDRIQHEHLYKLIEELYSDTRIVDLYKLFVGAFGSVGLGLGSQVSQISALMYPNEIDHTIKEKLGIKYYGRYMDDSYLIHKSKEYLEYCLSVIKSLCDKIGIVINDKKTQIVKLSKGFTFLKIKFNLLLSGKVIKRVHHKCIVKMRRKLKKFKMFLNNCKMKLNDIIIAYNSFRGHIKRCNSHLSLLTMDSLFYKLFA